MSANGLYDFGQCRFIREFTNTYHYSVETTAVHYFATKNAMQYTRSSDVIVS